MIYPIYVYGQPVLRKVAEDITPDYPELNELIKDMFDTLHASDGIGLAAPQIGKSIRLFVVDGQKIEDDIEMKEFRKIFINARIIEETGEPLTYNEGCLSLPGIREDVIRNSKIRIKYFDENFNPHDEVYDGFKARVIQHEYDHIEGVFFIDRISPLRRKLLKRKLSDISKGNVDIAYKIKIPKI